MSSPQCESTASLRRWPDVILRCDMVQGHDGPCAAHVHLVHEPLNEIEMQGVVVWEL